MANPLIRSNAAEVAAFLKQVSSLPAKIGQGRLIFALDATASRQPAWDQACQLQGAMFEAAAEMGGLQVQLVWYRGLDELHTSEWHATAAPLVQQMTKVHCAGGLTQIRRVLDHTLRESRHYSVNALIFVGDCVEEDPVALYQRAGQLAVLGIPVFAFHEDGDVHPAPAAILRELSSITHGAYCRFDQGSAEQLKALLSAVAVYAAGGRMALEHYSRRQGHEVKQLVHQLR